MADEGKKLAITDPTTGDIVRVRWFSPSSPTDDDINSILTSYRSQNRLKPLGASDVARPQPQTLGGAWNKIAQSAQNLGQAGIPFASPGARMVSTAMSGIKQSAEGNPIGMLLSGKKINPENLVRGGIDQFLGMTQTLSSPFSAAPEGVNETYGKAVETGTNAVLRTVTEARGNQTATVAKLFYTMLPEEDKQRVKALTGLGIQAGIGSLLAGGAHAIEEGKVEPQGESKIVSAVAQVGDQQYEGASHELALNKGGLSKDNTTEGKDWQAQFKTDDGRLITRDQAKEEFGITHSEEVPELKAKQDEQGQQPVAQTLNENQKAFFNKNSAEQLGVKFDGFQKVKNGEPLEQFTDTEGTGTTFYKNPGETLEQAISRSREKFKTSNKYVDDKPLTIEVSPNLKDTAKDIRYAASGKYNSQVVQGNQTGQLVARSLKSTGEDSAVWFYNEAHGDMGRLQEVLNDPDPKLDPYREDIRKALNLSDKGKTAYKVTRQFYDEGGAYSLKNGTIKNVVEDYANRIYAPEDESSPSEINNKGLSKFTRHTMERTYTGDKDVFDAIKDGHKPLTTKSSENLSIWNQEMARVNTNAETARALQMNGLGEYHNVGDVPEGFKAVPGLDKLTPIEVGKEGVYTEHPQVGKESELAIVHKQFVVPEKLYDGMKALFEPDKLKSWKPIRAVMELQSMRKIGMFAFSLFHDYALTTQLLGNTKGGVSMLTHLEDFNKLDTPEFNQRERFAAKHGLMTSMIEKNQDILRELTEPKSIIGKAEKAVGSLPGIKQGIDLAKWKTDLTFGKLQRWAKVNDFTIKAADYDASNPKATVIERTKALRGIAKEVNANYGGLNWKALGVTPTMQTAMRFLALAPDWTLSNAQMIKIATEKGVGGNAARAYWGTYLIGGIALTEALNKAFTGHYTDKNPKGHEFEVEAQPGVWVSVFRGAAGDAVKAYSMEKEKGLIAGAQQFAMGKASPLVSTAIGITPGASDYQGKKIINPKSGSGAQAFQAMKFVVENMSPIPISGSSVYEYMKQGEHPTLTGAAVVGTGLGRMGHLSKKEKEAKLKAFGE